MSQTLLFVAIQVVGSAVSLAFGPRRRPALCCALGFPVGLAVAVLGALALLLLHIPYRAVSVGALLALVLAAAVVVLRRRGLERRALLLAALWTAGFAAACLALSYANLAIMSHDSFIFVMLGDVIVADGALRPDVLALLDEWGVFTVVAQSMAGFTPQDFLYALPAIFGVSFVPLFAVSLWHAVGGRARRVALVTAAMFTIGMVVFHVLYLHTNMGSALYLYGFVTLFWLAETERDESLIPPAFLCLTAFALQRTETPLVALIFLALTVGQSELPRRSITIGLAAFTAAVGLWYEVLAHHVGAAGSFLTPMRCRLVEAALLAAFGWWLVSDRPPIRRLNRWLPLALGAAAAVAVAAAFAWKTDHMVESVRNWANNVFLQPLWGYSGFAVIALALLALPLPAPRFRQAFAIGIPVYLAFILLLALGRSPYRGYVDDSANRMTMHVVPLIFHYLGLKLCR